MVFFLTVIVWLRVKVLPEETFEAKAKGTLKWCIYLNIVSHVENNAITRVGE